MFPKKNKYGDIIFQDYPQFTPNLSPTEMFQLGSFGGTYWRPIYSSVINKALKNQHKKQKPWDISKLFIDIPENYLSMSKYDKNINKYKVKCGSSLEDWEEKGWIDSVDPYGWVQWYCYFYLGRRTYDDERQINRWLSFAGPKGRFRNNLINKIKARESKADDYTISPVIRQSLQHWGYYLTERDYQNQIM
tara:strand:+ start:1074 stop:1646 length:573 start_codon:yes stop_codon:yes gene_type:complete